MKQTERTREIRYSQSKVEVLKNGKTTEERKNDKRRLAHVFLHEEELIKLLRKYMVLPDGVNFHHAFYEHMNNGFVIVLQGDDLDVVPEGKIPPTIGNERIAIR